LYMKEEHIEYIWTWHCTWKMNRLSIYGPDIVHEIRTDW